jgi:hypothetical protein
VSALCAGSLANEEVNHQGQDRGVKEERENLMSKDCSTYRSVGYIHVRDGKASSDGEGEVGEVELIRILLARKVKPSGRLFGSIVLVSVVERKGAVKYSPRRDNSQGGHDSYREATCSF